MDSDQCGAAPPSVEQTEAAIRALADQLYCERVADARAMSAEEKLLAGEELFDYACSITLAGIHNQWPNATEAECQKILQERLDLRERMERRRWTPASIGVGTTGPWGC